MQKTQGKDGEFYPKLSVATLLVNVFAFSVAKEKDKEEREGIKK